MAAFSPTATQPASFSAALPRPSASFSAHPSPFPALAKSSGEPRLSFSTSLAKKKRKNCAVMMVTKLPNGKYIREDYLVKKLSAKEVKELLKSDRTVPVVVDFYATWCGPCILMAQELEMLAVEYGNNALFVKVDTDDEYDFSRDMQVRGLPTLYFISPDPNKDAIRTEGLVPREMIKNIIDNEM